MNNSTRTRSSHLLTLALSLFASSAVSGCNGGDAEIKPSDNTSSTSTQGVGGGSGSTASTDASTSNSSASGGGQDTATSGGGDAAQGGSRGEGGTRATASTSAATSTSTTSGGAGGGSSAYCKGILAASACTACLETSCCTDLAACSEATGCIDCAFKNGTCTGTVNAEKVLACALKNCSAQCQTDLLVPSCGTASNPSGGKCITVDATTVKCNPVTGSPCNVASGETCDADGDTGFSCYPGQNEAKACEACGVAMCGVGTTCMNGTCVSYCCTNGDCGSGVTCMKILESDVGVCLK